MYHSLGAENRPASEMNASPLSNFLEPELFWADRADGTGFFAAAAVDAFIGVDVVLRIALFDSFGGA